MTIRELLSEGLAKLKQAKVSEPELSARYLLEHVLQLSHIEMQLSLDKDITASQADDFYDLINKRCQSVPVQYLIGEVEFYDLKLKVDTRVLIPRPETEELVDYLLKEIKDISGLRLLDIGAGSGNIAIALATNLREASVTTVDISSEALELARENAALNNVADKINFICDDVFSDNFWAKQEPFDIIISNPPYVDSAEFDDLQPEVRLYEPQIALVSPGDVLAFYKAISSRAKSALKKGGLLYFEIGMGQSSEIKNIIESNLPDANVEIVNDMAGKDRIVIARV